MRHELGRKVPSLRVVMWRTFQFCACLPLPACQRDSECDERMLSNIRNNPRVPERQNCCLSPRVPSRRRRQENISNPLRHWMASPSSSCIVTNFHFFHRDPCHPSLSIREMGLFSVFFHGLRFPAFSRVEFSGCIKTVSCLLFRY